MHEFSIVQGLVNELTEQLQQQGITYVSEVHLRRGSAFSKEALNQAYQIFSSGTLLETAALVIETLDLDYTCPCGFHKVITSDDLFGHMFVCPQCGTVREVDEAHDLELLGIIVPQES